MVDVRREVAFLPKEARDLFVDSIHLSKSLDNLIEDFGSTYYFTEYRDNMILFNNVLSTYIALVRQHYGKLKKEKVELPDEYYILYKSSGLKEEKIELSGLQAFLNSFIMDLKRYHSRLEDYLPPKPALFTNINYATQIVTEMSLLADFILTITKKARDAWYSELGLVPYDSYYRIYDTIRMYVQYNAKLLDSLSAQVLYVLPRVTSDTELASLMKLVGELYYIYIYKPFDNDKVIQFHQDYDNLNKVLVALGDISSISSIKKDVIPEGIFLVDRVSFARDVLGNSLSRRIETIVTLMNKNPMMPDIARLDKLTIRRVLSGVSQEEVSRFWVYFVYYSIITPFKPWLDTKRYKVKA